ncbi:arginine-glutamic acid dipeptide repeats protein [Calliopsis andreniformis]|uniref:arginine-glutamic acid dipeptide repeats protein n=1 Tax=Calliopsis andreniformis TaxID=337506 RepID=UPI003FCE7250
MGIRKAEKKSVLACTMGLEAEVTNEKALEGVADIPEYREQINLDKEYRDFPEEKIWSPKEEVNEWVPFYVFMARSVLTFVQESQGIPNREAMENSCTGYAEQYITDILHDSEYLPEVALKTLFTKQLPQKLITRWTSADIELFIEGIVRHGKNFASIQKDLLPQKDTKDIVDFYYAWKWSEPAKQLRNCRRRRRVKTQRRFPSIGCVFGELSSPKIVTRSVAAASRLSSSLKKKDQAVPIATGVSTLGVKRKRSNPIVR